MPEHQQEDPDSYVRVVDRSPDGVVVRGAKLHITAASFGHDLMTIPTKAMKPNEQEYAFAACIPVNSPGVKIINTTYAPRHADLRDFPVSGKVSTPVALASSDKINPQVIIYLNRLSDLLFVLGRVCNHDGRDDVLWVPGKTQASGE